MNTKTNKNKYLLQSKVFNKNKASDVVDYTKDASMLAMQKSAETSNIDKLKYNNPQSPKPEQTTQYPEFTQSNAKNIQDTILDQISKAEEDSDLEKYNKINKYNDNAANAYADNTDIDEEDGDIDANIANTAIADAANKGRNKNNNYINSTQRANDTHEKLKKDSRYINILNMVQEMKSLTPGNGKTKNNKTKYIIVNNESNLPSILSTWFFIGKFPIAPGTMGSIAAYPLYALAIYLSMNTTLVNFISNATDYRFRGILYFMVGLLIIVGSWAIKIYQEKIQIHDHQSIVIDEVAGQLLTIAIAYNSLFKLSLYLQKYVHIDQRILIFLIALAFFRFFDINKPMGIRFIDRYMRSSFGVILDDLLAGVYAGSAIAVCVYFLC